MVKYFATTPKPNHYPDSSPTTTVTSPTGTATTTDFTEDDSFMIDDESFDCIDDKNCIKRNSFVAFKEVTCRKRDDNKRKTPLTNYVIAKVDNVTDNKSYNLRFLKYVRNGQYKAYYTWDLDRPNEIITDKDLLVLLKDPDYVHQPKECKQGAKISLEHKDKVHNFFFHHCLIETVK